MANEEDVKKSMSPRRKAVPEPRHSVLKAIPSTLQALHAAEDRDPALLMTPKQKERCAVRASMSRELGRGATWERIGACAGNTFKEAKRVH